MTAGRQLADHVAREILHLRLGTPAFEKVLRNAVRHASNRGVVRVSAVMDGGAREATLTIAGDGPGVSPGELATIFEPFFRGEGARPGEGHGLGPAITRGVVEAHGERGLVRYGRIGGLIFEIHLRLHATLRRFTPAGRSVNRP